MIGCDILSMSNETLNILTNDYVIAVNQDPLGMQGNKTKVDGTNEVWQVPLKDGKRAVLAVNRGDIASNITINWSDVGLDTSTVSYQYC